MLTLLAISFLENALLFLSAFGLLQGVLLATLLYFHPKADRTVTTLLAIYIGCISIPILMPVGQQLFTWQVIIFIEPFTLLIGPLLYLYVRSFSQKITFGKTWPHFIPFVAFVFLSFVVYNEVGLKYAPSSKVPPEVTRHPLSVIPVTIRLLQRLLYYFLAYAALRSYQRSILHLFSEISRINLRWMKWVVNGYLVLILCTMVIYSMILRYPEHFSKWVLLLGTLISVYIYMALVKGISQPTLWQVKPGLDKEKVEEKMHEVESLTLKPLKRVTTDSRMSEIAKRIVAAIENEKLYHEPELSLQDLANKLQLPSYQVSQAINEGLNKTFYDLINNYRVDEARRLLIDPRNKNYTILSVAFEAGFNSKTTFNTVFKKFTGQTPTDFRLQNSATAATA